MSVGVNRIINVKPFSKIVREIILCLIAICVQDLPKSKCQKILLAQDMSTIMFANEIRTHNHQSESYSGIKLQQSLSTGRL